MTDSSSLLESGNLPVADLARLALREGTRPRPIYQVHKWFARRFGSVFRSLLIASALPPDADFWQAYYDGVNLRGKTVLDPFVGGGTSVVEALRLGADVIGVDVDPVACAITDFETRAASMPDLRPVLERLKRDVGELLAPYYRSTAGNGVEVDVLHYFWVQVVDCQGCGERVEAHPHHQLAYDARGHLQWVFCPRCHELHTLHRSTAALECTSCGAQTSIKDGPVRFGRLTCPMCGTRERLIDVGTRTKRPPEWRLFALEYLDPTASFGRRPLPLTQRAFRMATERDQDVFDAAVHALSARTTDEGQIVGIPDREIPLEGRSDDRLPRYGYTRYRELFNPRQLLHLSLLGEAVAALDGDEQEALALALSDHLATNCMMTSYAFGWRRAVPLFSVRAFRHISRPVEINPWLDGTGRGTFPNAVRQVQRAISFARASYEPLLSGGFRPVANRSSTSDEGLSPGSVRIYHHNAEALDVVARASVDLVLTDPPYFDNIAYSELSDFFVPWLQMFGLAFPGQSSPIALEESLAAQERSPEALSSFEAALGRCFAEIARVLTSEGRLVFTYQHHDAGAWLALGRALSCAGLRAGQVFPLLGDSWRSPHTHQGSSKWDAVFVMVKDEGVSRDELFLTDAMAATARRHCESWSRRISRSDRTMFRDADVRNFHRASLVGAALGLVAATDAPGTKRPLAEFLSHATDMHRVPPTHGEMA